MIKISKSKAVPKILLTKGKAENKKNCADYVSNPGLYISSSPTFSSTFKIKNKIYGDKTVKDKLKEAQGGDKCKCCFCEKEQSDEYGAVEHFRPKGGYHSTKKQELVKPGYYWLGYEWSNLYFVCSTCNTNKLNLFPLSSGSKRAKSHRDGLRDEKPLLLDPGGRKNPRNHITFEGQFPRGITAYGKKTIEICGLDRDYLNDKRKKLIANIDVRMTILATESLHKKARVDEAKQFIKDSIKADAEFSATAIDYIKNSPVLSI